jgi:hypothetical protein
MTGGYSANCANGMVKQIFLWNRSRRIGETMTGGYSAN